MKIISPITFTDRLIKKNEFDQPFTLTDHQREILRLAFAKAENVSKLPRRGELRRKNQDAFKGWRTRQGDTGSGRRSPTEKANALRAIRADEVYSALELKKIIDAAALGWKRPCS